MSEEKKFHPDVMMGRRGRKEYTEWFLYEYAKDKHKKRMTDHFGEAYYNEVMRIHQERLDRNDFNIGPQSAESWNELHKSLTGK